MLELIYDLFCRARSKMENFNFTFSPSEDETKGLMPCSLLRNRGSGFAPRFNTLYTFILGYNPVLSTPRPEILNNRLIRLFGKNTRQVNAFLNL